MKLNVNLTSFFLSVLFFILAEPKSNAHLKIKDEDDIKKCLQNEEDLRNQGNLKNGDSIKMKIDYYMKGTSK